MERSLHNENFEKLLKENADQFKMTPSKKVWHGIYNDLHPGRRWPSIAISFLILFTLVVIGHLNTNNSYRNSLAYSGITSDDEITADNNSGKTYKHKHPSKRNGDTKEENNIVADNLSSQPEAGNTPMGNVAAPLAGNTVTSLLPEGNPVNNQVNSPAATTENFNPAGTDPSIKNQKNISDKSFNKTKSESTDLKNKNPKLLAKAKKEDSKQEEKSNSLNESKTEEVAGNLQFNLKKSKMNWVYYITPTVSYRTLSGNSISGSSVTLGAAAPYSINNSEGKPAINHPAIGFEFGGEVTYEISKRLRFIGGVQLNYSRYTIEANNIHPVMASLLLNSDNINSPYVLSAVSQYGNRTGPAEVTLQNYSFQASLPVGLQYKIGGNDNIEINAAATFQPSFVIAGKSYILSTDKRNFISDPSLSRKWNMSSNFGTFISFKANSFTWQIGPQLHYQWLSTFSPNYPVKEHLIDYGVRFGVTKTLK